MSLKPCALQRACWTLPYSICLCRECRWFSIDLCSCCSIQLPGNLLVQGMQMVFKKSVLLSQHTAAWRALLKLAAYCNCLPGNPLLWVCFAGQHLSEKRSAGVQLALDPRAVMEHPNFRSLPPALLLCSATAAAPLSSNLLLHSRSLCQWQGASCS